MTWSAISVNEGGSFAGMTISRNESLASSSPSLTTTVIVATHELGLVERYGKRTVRLERGKLTEDRPARGARA